MGFEYKLIGFMGFLVLSSLVLILNEPNNVPYSNLLKTISIEKGVYSDDPAIYQKTIQKEGSTCYTSPSVNNFCFEKPRMNDEYGISYIRGENDVQGELHFDPVEKGVNYFTIKNMTRINDETALITLADKNYSRSNINGTIYSIDEKFEHSMVLKKFDSFISHCHNKQGTSFEIVQYLGITTIEDRDYFMTWHTIGSSEHGIRCDYPEIMEYSLQFNFEDL